jgi:hypothetical protein
VDETSSGSCPIPGSVTRDRWLVMKGLIWFLCRSGMDEFCSVLEELVNSKDKKLSSRLETLVKFQYRRHIRNTTDPFKR